MATLRPTAPTNKIGRRLPPEWLEDLAWHKRQYPGGHCYIWLDQHLHKLVRWYTDGRTEFTTRADYEVLQKTRERLRYDRRWIEGNAAKRFYDLEACPLDWGTVLGTLEIKEDLVFECYRNIGVDSLDHFEVAAVMSCIHFRSPLVEAWEILHLRRMWLEGELIITNLINTLADELDMSRELSLVRC